MTGPGSRAVEGLKAHQGLAELEPSSGSEPNHVDDRDKPGRDGRGGNPSLFPLRKSEAVLGSNFVTPNERTERGF